jgi:hypothetical protein
MIYYLAAECYTHLITVDTMLTLFMRYSQLLCKVAELTIHSRLAHHSQYQTS